MPCDRIQIQQVLLNLLSNAFDALTDSSTALKQVTVRSLLLKGEAVRIEVQDNGRGIDENIMDQLFEPFMTTKPKGMGMGLSICSSIIEAHGGQLLAINHDQDGATFHFQLPLKGMV